MEEARPKRLTRMQQAQDLLESSTELTIELLVEEPANTVDVASRSGAYPSLSDTTSELTSELDMMEEQPSAEEIQDEASVDELEAIDRGWEISLEGGASVDVSFSITDQRNALLPPVPSDATQELNAEELEEEPIAVAQTAVETVDALVTADLEVLVEQQREAAPTLSEPILIRCKVGETLPPGAVYAEELPRFPISSQRKLFGHLRLVSGNAPPRARPPRGPLPAFSIEEPVRRASRVPAPRLPKFILD